MSEIQFETKVVGHGYFPESIRTEPEMDAWYEALENRTEQIGQHSYMGHNVCDGCGVSIRNYTVGSEDEIKRWIREHFPHRQARGA